MIEVTIWKSLLKKNSFLNQRFPPVLIITTAKEDFVFNFLKKDSVVLALEI